MKPEAKQQTASGFLLSMEDMLNIEESVFALKERIKELSCLYRIAELASMPNLDPGELLQRAVEMIPPAMQYPEVACAHLMVNGVSYYSPGARPTKNCLTVNISTNFTTVGCLQVFYPDDASLKFLNEEEKLIETLAQHISLIMERRNAQEYNAKLQEQLRHADRLATIGQLSAGIAHEINEPLSAILGFAQLILAETELPEAAYEDMQKIVNASLHAREVVRKLMLFSRQVPPKMAPLDINKLIEEGFYFLENRCAKQGVQILRDLQPNLPPVTADASQMHQVLVNLSVNSMQAMPKGGLINIKTRLVDDNVVISISDTGQGMDSEILQKIFIPFFTTKDIDQGTGLGLSVVHGIISAHNAAIKVESEPGKGSTFKIYMKVSSDECS
jgi:signal transduction histidine kinase